MNVSVETGGEVWQQVLLQGIRRTGLEPDPPCAKACARVKHPVWRQAADPARAQMTDSISRQVAAQLFQVRP